ncbi:MAG: glycoside hydrolase family 99-like domain-containing protein, partial [Anaerolineales bacterium]|nr:glycoside hydrolase family 99-like domain-containing protein [Anaerolineales bacterium]
MSSAIKTFLLIASLLLSGCSITIQTEFPTPTAPIPVTATLPPTSTPRPSETSTPPPSAPTIVPVQGTTSTQLNVRAEPSTVSETLGIIAANTSIQIVGRDPGGNWWQILYEAGAEGKAWVAAQYVETEAGPEVPVIGGGAESDAAHSAVVIQELNIRSGPGTGFNSLGILNTNDVVNLTGKNRDGSWLQIEFADGPDGRGWVNAAFVRTNDAENLPIVSDTGEVVGTGTPMDTPLPPTPTLAPAPMDFDSADAPLKTILFERVGTQTLIYNGDVSQPDGDAEDWQHHFEYLLRVFRDPRYIRVDGKPMFLIYRSASIEPMEGMLRLWRQLAERAGLPGLHIVSMRTAFPPDTRDGLFDAFAEFEPVYTFRERKPFWLRKRERWLRQYRRARLRLFGSVSGPPHSYHYSGLWGMIERRKLPERTYPGAFVDWDNTPRRGLERGIVMRKFKARAFEKGIRTQLRKALDAGAPFVFINAWNEWAEGAYMEPDEARGTFFLDTVRDAVAEIERAT